MPSHDVREILVLQGGEDVKSWENPLPNLTWSHLPVATLRHLLDQGGFDWEVRDATRRHEAGAAAD